MKITYHSYPMLLHTSFDKENAPDVLPFVMPDEKTIKKVQANKGFQQLLPTIAIKNTVAGKNATTNIYLSDTTFQKVEYDEYFRNTQFRQFFTSSIKPKYGTILMKEGATYVYMLLSKQETKGLKNLDGCYIAVALFIRDVFLGFEEGVITNNGIEVNQTGIYNGGMDIGGYISFVIITLSHAEGKTFKLVECVSEKIISL
ncbi:hypothetical protein [Dyadobacter jejuensis]|nr:hypothetical protein [Dyadobacter jejuensis]